MNELIVEKKKKEKEIYKTREIEVISYIIDGINKNIINAHEHIKNSKKMIKDLTKDRDTFYKIKSILKGAQ
jgi:hypothetical protein